jgi:hypothetical protein
METKGLVMNKVIVDPELRSKLHNLVEEVELCDENERTLGYFLPAEAYEELQHVFIDMPFTPEEMKRRREETGGRSLAEIWKSLRQT